jgi:hypothetical protein
MVLDCISAIEATDSGLFILLSHCDEAEIQTSRFHHQPPHAAREREADKFQPLPRKHCLQHHLLVWIQP